MTTLVQSIDVWRKIRQQLSAETTVGFVPTMGNLHEGHASLLRHSLRENDRTVLSIFINPTQFNNKQDLITYPKTLEQDIKLAQDLGVHYIFNPSYQAIYPDAYHFQLHEIATSQLMEGKARTGHFTGVLTIILKLINLVKPTRLYLGEKDYQQLKLVSEMVKACFLDTKIVACPTIRNSAGLALSSRNSLLSEPHQQLASKFYQCLSANIPIEQVITQLQSLGFKVDYVEEHWGRRFGAVTLGKVRLIDNIKLSESKLS